MRILHFFKTYLPDSVGGIEQVINQLCRSGEAHGIENEVLTLSANPEPSVVEVDGHRVHRARLDLQLASTGFSYSVLPRFRALAAEADIINFHFPWPFMDVAHYLADIRKPNVVTYHSDIIRQKTLLRIYRPLMRRFLQQTDRIIVTSPNYFATSSILGEFKEKVSVIPIGLHSIGIGINFPTLTLLLLDRFPHHRGAVSSVQAFVSLVLSSILAGAISPLVSGSALTLALTAAIATSLGFVSWRIYRAIESREASGAAAAA